VAVRRCFHDRARQAPPQATPLELAHLVSLRREHALSAAGSVNVLHLSARPALARPRLACTALCTEAPSTPPIPPSSLPDGGISAAASHVKTATPPRSLWRVHLLLSTLLYRPWRHGRLPHGRFSGGRLPTFQQAKHRGEAPRCSSRFMASWRHGLRAGPCHPCQPCPSRLHLLLDPNRSYSIPAHSRSRRLNPTGPPP
jgi:hypothetical protein